MTRPVVRKLRCAVYTRKSSEVWDYLSRIEDVIPKRVEEWEDDGSLNRLLGDHCA